MAPPGVLCPTFPGAAATTPRLVWRPVEEQPLMPLTIHLIMDIPPKKHVLISMEAPGTIHKHSTGSEIPPAAGSRLQGRLLWEEVWGETQRPQSC